MQLIVSVTTAGTCLRSDFDILTTAQLYSQLSGVLAGFAFAALVVLLTAQLQGARHVDDRVRDVANAAEQVKSLGETGAALAAKRSADRPVGRQTDQATADAAVVLTAAVIALVLSAISYAILSGGGIAGPRAAAEEVAAGAGLVTSTSVLFYAIVRLFDAAEGQALARHGVGSGPLARASGWLRATFGFFVVPLSSFYLGSSAFEYLEVHHGDLDWLMNLFYCLAVLPLLSALVGRRQRLRTHPAQNSGAALAFTRISTIVIATLTATFVAVDSKWTPCDLPPLAIVVAVVIVTNALLCLAAWRFACDPRPAPG